MTVGMYQKNSLKMEIKDIVGNTVTVTNLPKAIKKCRACIASPYILDSGHTVGENMAFMLGQLLSLQHNLRAKKTPGKGKEQPQ